MSDLIERLSNPRFDDWIATMEKAEARIKELEAKNERLEFLGLDDRESIEAATIEKCASHIEKLGWTAAANSIRELKAETIK